MMLQLENTLFIITMLLYFASMILYFVFVAVKRDCCTQRRLSAAVSARGVCRSPTSMSSPRLLPGGFVWSV